MPRTPESPPAQKPKEEDGPAPDPGAVREATDTALRLLARRDHTVGEIRRKLALRGIDPEAAAGAVAACQAAGYLDDETVARRYLQELRTKNYGPFYIRNKMAEKGVDRALADALMEEIGSPEDDADRARKALTRRRNSLDREKDSRKRRARAYQYLRSRGFGAETIRAVLDGMEP